MSLSPTRYQFVISARLPRRANTIADRGRKLPVEPRAAWPRMIAGSRVAQQLGAGRGYRRPARLTAVPCVNGEPTGEGVPVSGWHGVTPRDQQVAGQRTVKRRSMSRRC